MRVRLLAFFLLLPAFAVSAQEFVYPRPDAKLVRVQRDVPFDGPRGARLAFDLYRPAGDQRVPVAITCNVGIAGLKNAPGYVGWGHALAAAGLASVHYDATSDATGSFDALLAALRSREGELGIDLSRIVLWGGSSNVRATLPLAMDPARTYVRGAILYYGWGEAPAIRTDRPVLFVRSGLDSAPLNDAVDAMLAKAIKANAPWTIVNYPGGFHGFDIFNDTDLSREIIARTIEFMTAVTSNRVHDAYLASAEDAALGSAYLRGDWKTAAEGYRKRAAAHPDDGEIQLRLGIALDNLGESAKGLEHIERAFALGRGGPRDTMLPAARAAARSGNQARALVWVERALQTPWVTSEDLRRDPALAPLLTTPAGAALVDRIDRSSRAERLLAEGKADEAISLLDNAPENVLNPLGYRLLGQGRVNDAVRVFEKATENWPGSANAWDSLSEALESAGKKDEALRAAGRALELNPDPAVRSASEARIDRLSRK